MFKFYGVEGSSSKVLEFGPQEQLLALKDDVDFTQDARGRGQMTSERSCTRKL